MTEKILEYDRKIVPQQTGWWCGPASVQVVLNNKGIHVEEPDMALELGTHRGGTDHVGLFPPVLKKHTGVDYFAVTMPNDPPTAEQKERLWREVVSSINAGHGVIANIVAPPSNYPRGVKGSASPYYAGGTVYHYFSIMGFDDTPGARAMWIADSGFQPQGYWMSFDQLATLIPPKGYIVAPGVMPEAPPPPAKLPGRTGITAQTLSDAMGGVVPLSRYEELLPGFAEAMVEAGCTNVNRAAMWCAQLGHESVGLKYMAELWGPTFDQQRYDTHPGLGNIATGDGFRYKGRGPIQITGRGNYGRLSAWAFGKGYVPTPTFFVDNPTELEAPKYGFLGAVWYWTVSRPQINDLSDRRDLEGVTRAINGGLNGIDDRRRRYQKCLALGEALLPGDPADESAIWDEIGRAVGL